MKIAIAVLLLCGFAVFSIKVKNQLITKTSPLTAVKLNEPMPDFTLPDVNGVPRSLSQLRGKKVFLATWASW